MYDNLKKLIKTGMGPAPHSFGYKPDYSSVDRDPLAMTAALSPLAVGAAATAPAWAPAMAMAGAPLVNRAAELGQRGIQSAQAGMHKIPAITQRGGEIAQQAVRHPIHSTQMGAHNLQQAASRIPDPFDYSSRKLTNMWKNRPQLLTPGQPTVVNNQLYTPTRFEIGFNRGEVPPHLQSNMPPLNPSLVSDMFTKVFPRRDPSLATGKYKQFRDLLKDAPPVKRDWAEITLKSPGHSTFGTYNPTTNQRYLSGLGSSDFQRRTARHELLHQLTTNAAFKNKVKHLPAIMQPAAHLTRASLPTNFGDPSITAGRTAMLRRAIRTRPNRYTLGNLLDEAGAFYGMHPSGSRLQGVKDVASLVAGPLSTRYSHGPAANKRFNVVAPVHKLLSGTTGQLTRQFVKAQPLSGAVRTVPDVLRARKAVLDRAYPAGHEGRYDAIRRLQHRIQNPAYTYNKTEDEIQNKLAPAWVEKYLADR